MSPAPPIAMISDPTRSFVPGTTPRTVVVAVVMAKPSCLVMQAGCPEPRAQARPTRRLLWGTPYALDEQAAVLLFHQHFVGDPACRETTALHGVSVPARNEVHGGRDNRDSQRLPAAHRERASKEAN